MSYYEKNKEYLKQKAKEYKGKNKDIIKLKNKEYKLKNKIKISQQQQIKIYCICGSVVSTHHYKRHTTSNKHKDFENINITI